VTNSPRINSRKRPRSLTPSDGGAYGNSEDDLLRSPLAKRKKLAAERTGSSRLKQGITADDLASSDRDTASNASVSGPGTPVEAPTSVTAPAMPVSSSTDMDDNDDDDEDDDTSDSDDSSSDDTDEEDDDDDFLARALGEDAG